MARTKFNMSVKQLQIHSRLNECFNTLTETQLLPINTRQHRSDACEMPLYYSKSCHDSLTLHWGTKRQQSSWAAFRSLIKHVSVSQTSQTCEAHLISLSVSSLKVLRRDTKHKALQLRLVSPGSQQMHDSSVGCTEMLHSFHHLQMHSGSDRPPVMISAAADPAAHSGHLWKRDEHFVLKLDGKIRLAYLALVSIKAKCLD